MSHMRILTIAIAICLGALGVFAFTGKSTAPQGSDVIIIKGGSLTVQCPTNDQCLSFNTTTMKFEHKDKTKKVIEIVVKDESGKVIGDFSSVNFPNGKPSIEVTYK